MIGNDEGHLVRGEWYGARHEKTPRIPITMLTQMAKFIAARSFATRRNGLKREIWLKRKRLANSAKIQVVESKKVHKFDILVTLHQNYDFID